MTTQHDPPRQAQPRNTSGLDNVRKHIGADFSASLVVFLVALPLCVGIAVASGVPAELGLITGVVGGIVVGLLPGSTMQVSGPAAGLTVLVSSAVGQHGLGALGLIVLGAGALQIAMGLTGIGRWFRAISPSVVQGMLAGIGLVLILGQLYPLGAQEQPNSTGGKFAGLPGLLSTMVTTPQGLSGLAVGVVTLVLLFGWPHLPARAHAFPGPLAAVVIGSGLTLALALPLPKVQVSSLLEAVNMPSAASPGTLAAVFGSMVVFALIASAESLFSAAAVDRMHDGPKTEFNKELVAQGVGNAVCGVLGALPMTAVIVRSSTNVRAGARTRTARVLHGVWLLLFVAALPWVLAMIPKAVLAAVLLHAGWKLLEVGRVVALVREHRAEALVVLVTAGLIVGTDLLTGTLAGLVLATVKMAFEVSRMSVRTQYGEDHVRVELGGTATFVRLPRLLEHLERLPEVRTVEVDMSPARHVDRACHQAVTQWAEQRRRGDCQVEVRQPVPA